MHIGDDILDAVRTDGYAVMEGVLTPDELTAAQEGLFGEFPDPTTTSPTPSSTGTWSSTSSRGSDWGRSRRGH